MPDSDDFYEDDEPVESVRAAFERGRKGTTGRPRDLNQLAKSIVDDVTTTPGPLRVLDFSRVEIVGGDFMVPPIATDAVDRVKIG